MTHELNGYRDERWYIEQANSAADKAYGGGDVEQALTHRTIALNVLMKRVLRMTTVNASAITLLYERAGGLSTDRNLKTLCDAADALSSAPVDNNYIFVRSQAVDGREQVDCIGGNVQLDHRVARIETGYKVDVHTVSKQVLETTDEAWSRTDSRLLSVRLEATPENLERSIGIEPPTDIYMGEAKDFRKVLDKNHYKKKNRSFMLSTVRSLSGDIDWSRRLDG